jgi:hypothetical protein
LPVSVAGERAGGPAGYSELLAVIDDPERERHAELSDWIDDSFDPQIVDADAPAQEVEAHVKPRSRKATPKKTPPHEPRCPS